MRNAGLSDVNYFIITGTSSGIGAELARLLLEDGNVVFGISRRDAVHLIHNHYTHFKFDLSKVHEIENTLAKIFARIDFDHADMVCLINNAALLEPLKVIENCHTEEIIENLQVSLIAPMILTSCFIRRMGNMSMRKKIINITSESARYPAPGMSVYCSAKAGMNMFTQCVGLEQVRRENPIEIIAVAPGMVDTEMQLTAREKNPAEFEMAHFFKQAHELGELMSTRKYAQYLVKLIDKKIKPGKILKYSER